MPTSRTDLPAKRRRGRPSLYSEAIAEEICLRLCMGQSLRRICRDKDMPSRETVFTWLACRADFLDRYTRARQIQADIWHDEMIDLADESALDKLEIQKNRLRIETRRWLCAVAKPHVYSQRMTVKQESLGESHEDRMRKLWAEINVNVKIEDKQAQEIDITPLRPQIERKGKEDQPSGITDTSDSKMEEFPARKKG